MSEMNHADHSHGSQANARRLRLALALTAVTMVIEAGGGFWSRSLALLADAGHMLTDVAALGFGLFAFWLSERPRTARRTFGWRRFEIFAAFLNGLALWVVSGLIAYEAYARLRAPAPVRSGLMLIVAVFGLAINIGVGAILFGRRNLSLNIRGAFLHVLADAMGSVGVLAAAILIRLTGSPVWDPIVSVAVCLLILWSSGRLILESFHILMEGAPRGLEIGAVRKTLASIPGVVDVHDLHVWTITSEFVSLSAHLKVRPDADAQQVLRQARDALSEGFGVSHTTLQLECAGLAACETASCEEPEAGHGHTPEHGQG